MLRFDLQDPEHPEPKYDGGLWSRENGRYVLYSDCIDEIKRLRAELARYKTPLVDDVEFLPSDPDNHEVMS